MSTIRSISEIRIPGTFVVMQGLPGDGLVNTIDSTPELVDVDEYKVEKDSSSDTMHAEVPLNLIGSSLKTQGRFPPTNLARPPLSVATSVSVTQNNSSMEDSYIVVEDEEEDNDPDAPTSHVCSRKSPRRTQLSSPQQQETLDAVPGVSPQQQSAISDWEDACWKQQLDDYRDWQETWQANHAALLFRRGEAAEDLHSLASSFSSACSSHVPGAWWLTSKGHLAILDGLPQRDSLPRAIGQLSPGSTVIGKAVVTVDSEDYSLIPVTPREEKECLIYPMARSGTLQILKFELNSDPSTEAYVVLSRNGYPFMGPGLPTTYTDPIHWIWRVTYRGGAVVRGGVDLDAAHTASIPYGSLLYVSRKSVNAMGLSRLQVTAVVEKIDTKSVETISGWVSEFLNPLSGQSGAIVQPLPFPVPAVYRVKLPAGAIVRNDVELSSPEIGKCNAGALITITGRAFSEHPTERCIERLRVSGRGGWISLRINKQPPHDVLIADLTGVDSSFDHDHPALFHIQEMRKVRQRQQHQEAPNSFLASGTNSVLSSVDDEEKTSETSSIGCIYTRCKADQASDSSNPSRSKSPSARKKVEKNETCVICLTEARTATMVHSGTGHIACCLRCARILKARNDPCPVCRLPIDTVIQHFWA